MARSIKVVPPKYGEKTEWYAIKADTLGTYEVVVYGPAPTADGVTAMIEPCHDKAEWIITTKVKRVVVE